VTRTAGLAIGVTAADCGAILFVDPRARVIGAAHAGWKGALGGILEATVEAMRKLGAKPERITAAIGPAISQDAYEVGAEFVERFVAEEPGSAAFFIIDQASGEPHFDLPAYVGERLARAGVGSIAELGLCTYCEESRLFSYRRSQHHGEDDYGRQISAIVLA
jgi:YfiH family protein